jgi:hypothetical protein
MASRYYALEIGDNEYEVSEGASTQSKTVEIAINLDDSATRDQVLVAIDNIKNYILRDIWPPA